MVFKIVYKIKLFQSAAFVSKQYKGVRAAIARAPMGMDSTTNNTKHINIKLSYYPLLIVPIFSGEMSFTYLLGSFRCATG